jgi:hypothetical protein
MIISASYRTDIPTFYGEWFMNRLRARYCQVVNPYGRQVYRVSLAREDVDGFVFWTKNLGPFLERLREVGRRGYPFVVQYSINAYPRSLEVSVVDARQSVHHMRWLCDEYGPRVGVWRYDPILLTAETSADFHLTNFERLARELEGSTDEVVISFAQIYRKTERNLRRLGFSWEDPPAGKKREMAGALAAIAKSRGMQLTICSQRELLVPGAEDARCIDARRLEDVAGSPIRAQHKAHRKACGCYQSRDIGDYDTCPHGCVYCYAVVRRTLAQERFRQHDPAGEMLFAERGSSSEE